MVGVFPNAHWAFGTLYGVDLVYAVLLEEPIIQAFRLRGYLTERFSLLYIVFRVNPLRNFDYLIVSLVRKIITMKAYLLLFLAPYFLATVCSEDDPPVVNTEMIIQNESSVNLIFVTVESNEIDVAIGAQQYIIGGQEWFLHL